MDAMLNVLNSAPKVTKKRKPKPETTKKPQDSQLATPLSPIHLSSKSDLPSPPKSPILSPSTLDLDSLTLSQSSANVDESSQSFSESITSSDYVPLPTENNSVEIEPNLEPMINIEPISEKPPQLKVC